MHKLDNEHIRVIKISKDALFEFIYEQFIDSQEELFDIDSVNVIDTFDIDFEKGNFIFCVHNAEDENGDIIPFPQDIDLQQLMKVMPDTTSSIYSENCYKEYTKDELLELSKKGAIQYKGLNEYKKLIDDLATMSQHCVDSNCVKKGKVPGIDAKIMGINDVLNKLSQSDRDILSQYVLETYHSGIYDTLEHLEWLRCCKDMVMTIDSEELPLGQFEGIGNDYIGRRNVWNWPDE